MRNGILVIASLILHSCTRALVLQALGSKGCHLSADERIYCYKVLDNEGDYYLGAVFLSEGWTTAFRKQIY